MRRSVRASSGRVYRAPTDGAGQGARSARRHLSAMRAVQASPPSAASFALPPPIAPMLARTARGPYGSADSGPTATVPPASAPRRSSDPYSMLRSLPASGVPLALGSDSVVGGNEANPFLNIMLAST